MERDFEKEVLERLTKIETKLDDYGNMREKTETAYSLSQNNKKEIDEINERIKWITRTVAGAFITGIIGIVIILIKIGMGIK